MANLTETLIRPDDPEFNNGDPPLLVWLVRALQDACKLCRTPVQSGMKDGYTCSRHRELVALAFKTLREPSCS